MNGVRTVRVEYPVFPIPLAEDVDVVAFATFKSVVAGVAVEQVIAGVAFKSVVAGSTVEGVIAGAAFKSVVAGVAVYQSIQITHTERFSIGRTA